MIVIGNASISTTSGKGVACNTCGQGYWHATKYPIQIGTLEIILCVYCKNNLQDVLVKEESLY